MYVVTTPDHQVCAVYDTVEDAMKHDGDHIQVHGPVPYKPKTYPYYNPAFFTPMWRLKMWSYLFRDVGTK